MEELCPLCRERLTGVDYVTHLGEAHGLHDDPGTSSEGAAPARDAHEEPVPARPSGGPSPLGIRFTDARAPMGLTLLDDEEVVSVLYGEGPRPPAIAGKRSRRGKIAAGVILGGAVGAAVVAAVTPKGDDAGSRQGRIAPRTLVVTSQRAILLEHQIPTSAFWISTLTRVSVKTAGPGRRTAVLRSREGRTLRAEAARAEVEAFVREVEEWRARPPRAR